MLGVLGFLWPHWAQFWGGFEMSRLYDYEEIGHTGTANLLDANLRRAIEGKKGQEFLKKLLAALDAMELKELHTDDFKNKNGGLCAIGCYANHFKIRVDDLYSDDAFSISKRLGISKTLAFKIIFQNDENLVNDEMRIDFLLVGPVRPRFPEWGSHHQVRYVPDPDAPRKRWEAMRQWVSDNILG